MKITHPTKAYEYFFTRMRMDVEEFWIAALSADKDVIASQCLFRGTADACLFHPRDVFRFACMNNAVSIIVAHNHPSGSALPSELDKGITEQILTLSILMQIPMEDHLIVCKDGLYYSFLLKGQLATSVSGLV